MPCTGQEAVDLLIGPADVVAVIVRTGRAGIAARVCNVGCLVNRDAVLRVVERDLRAVWRYRLNRVACVWRNTQVSP